MNRTSEEHLSTADFVSVGNEIQKVNKPAEPVTHEPDTAAPGPLFAPDIAQSLRGEWTDVQAGFVDEPREAVRHADELVATAMKKLAEGFAEQRNELEKQWDRGTEVSTEDLRIAFRKYRAFFERLLSIQVPA